MKPKHLLFIHLLFTIYPAYCFFFVFGSVGGIRGSLMKLIQYATKSQSCTSKIPYCRKSKEIQYIKLCETLCLCDFVADISIQNY